MLPLHHRPKQENDIALWSELAQMFSMNKKLRNRLLALGCLVVFLAAGALFYVNWVVQKPFAVILFLADNLTPSVLTPARLYAGGADDRLQLESLQHLALISTHANDFAVADAASASASIASGRKINNRSLVVESAKEQIPTLLEIAQARGRATGLVSNAALTDVGPAAFYAKLADPLDTQAIALRLVEAGNVNVLFGGGAADFLPESKEGRRRDGRDLMLEMRNKGYDIVRNKAEMLNTPLWRLPRVFGLFGMGNLSFAEESPNAASEPTLAEMVLQAIQLLQYNPKGYFLVVDAALAGKAAAQNEGERTLREILALDRAVAVARAYAGDNALIIVAGRQSIGGLRLNGFPLRNDKGAGLLGVNAQGVPSLTWSTGPGSGTRAAPEGASLNEPVAFKMAAAIGVAEDTIAAGSGPGAEALDGFRDNTEIFRIMEKGL